MLSSESEVFVARTPSFPTDPAPRLRTEWKMSSLCYIQKYQLSCYEYSQLEQNPSSHVVACLLGVRRSLPAMVFDMH